MYQNNLFPGETLANMLGAKLCTVLKSPPYVFAANNPLSRVFSGSFSLRLLMNDVPEKYQLILENKKVILTD